MITQDRIHVAVAGDGPNAMLLKENGRAWCVPREHCRSFCKIPPLWKLDRHSVQPSRVIQR
jgi:hypothetical protein